MSVKKALKEGLKPQKEPKDSKSDYSEKGSRDKAIKSFRKMSGNRGDMPL
jgi:hypothetical protein|tara:strand:+ start:194 stop:343 length:150 start_codon:yes stop_codon:yes gene_type:complete